MFFHNFKYTFKVLLKNKTLIFWTVIWPLILGTMFYLAFSNLEEAEKLSTINLGIVDNSSYRENVYLVNTIDVLSNKDNNEYLFDVVYDSKERLDDLLNNKDIDGYIMVSDNPKLVIKENGINQTVIKYVVDQVYEYQKLVEEVVDDNIKNNREYSINQIYKDVLSEIYSNNTYINDLSKDNISYIVIEFYTLIAMAALYGALVTSDVVSNYLANINKKGARITIAPVGRLKIILGGLLASLIIQIFTIAILLIYTILILNIDYGNRMDLVILLSIVGSLTGSSLGLAVGSFAFKNDNTRVGVTMAIVMLGCFFSGMMGVSMKYVIDKNIPIINILNPANMITDGFYSLYYYDSLDRYVFNMVSLIITTIGLVAISYILMRRKKYDSI